MRGSYTIIVKDDEGKELLNFKCNKDDLSYELKNDLEKSTGSIYSILPSRMVVRGTSLKISAYSENEKYHEEMDRAMDDNFKDLLG